MVELLIDWVKHAFITRFNELSSDVYKEFTISLAYDMTQTRQKHAFSDHSDLVARRMGFIPFPLGVVLIKALYTAISIENVAAVLLCLVAFITLISCRILNTICALGKACDLMQSHQKDRERQSAAAAATAAASTSSNVPSTPAANSAPSMSAHNPIFTLASSHSAAIINTNIPGIHPLPVTPLITKAKSSTTTTDTSTSPLHSFSPLQRSVTVEDVPDKNRLSEKSNTDLLADPNLGVTALFSNSDVDLDDVCLNDNVLNGSAIDVIAEEQVLTRSVPDLQQETENSIDRSHMVSMKRTHRRSESEPFIQPHVE